MSQRREKRKQYRKIRNALVPVAMVWLIVSFLVPRGFSAARVILFVIGMACGIASDILRRKVTALERCPYCDCLLAEDILGTPDGEQVICRGCGKEIPNPKA